MKQPEWEAPDEEWSESRKFAAERCHNDAKEVSTHARTTANSVLLVNGAALTALISYIGSNSQNGKSAELLYAGVTAVSMLFYLGGVISALYCQFYNQTGSVEWMRHWFAAAQTPSDTLKMDLFYEKGMEFKNKAEVCLLRSIYCFVGGSLAIFLRYAGVSVQLLGHQ